MGGITAQGSGGGGGSQLAGAFGNHQVDFHIFEHSHTDRRRLSDYRVFRYFIAILFGNHTNSEVCPWQCASRQSGGDNPPNIQAPGQLIFLAG
jgi:hypothetical protein